MNWNTHDAIKNELISEPFDPTTKLQLDGLVIISFSAAATAEVLHMY